MPSFHSACGLDEGAERETEILLSGYDVENSDWDTIQIQIQKALLA